MKNKDEICQPCPRNGKECKGEGSLIPGCCQCIDKRKIAIAHKDKPDPKTAIPTLS